MATETPGGEQGTVQVPNHEVRLLDAGGGGKGQQVEVMVMLPGVSDISDIEVSIEPPDTIHVDVPQRYHLQLRLAVPIEAPADSISLTAATGELRIDCRMVDLTGGATAAGEAAAGSSGSSSSACTAAASSSGAVNRSNGEAAEVDNSSSSGGIAAASKRAGPAPAPAGASPTSGISASSTSRSSRGLRLARRQPPRPVVATRKQLQSRQRQHVASLTATPPAPAQEAAAASAPAGAAPHSVNLHTSGPTGGAQGEQDDAEQDEEAQAYFRACEEDVAEAERRYGPEPDLRVDGVVKHVTYKFLCILAPMAMHPPLAAHANNPVGWWCACWQWGFVRMAQGSYLLLAWATDIPARVPCGPLGCGLLWCFKLCVLTLSITAMIFESVVETIWRLAWQLGLTIAVLPGMLLTSNPPMLDWWSLTRLESEALHVGLTKLVLACSTAMATSAVLQATWPFVLRLAVSAAGLLLGALCWLGKQLLRAGTAPRLYWSSDALCFWSIGHHDQAGLARITVGAYASVALAHGVLSFGLSKASIVALGLAWMKLELGTTLRKAISDISNNNNGVTRQQLITALAPGVSQALFFIIPAMWRLVLMITPLTSALCAVSAAAAQLAGYVGSAVTAVYSVFAAITFLLPLAAQLMQPLLSGWQWLRVLASTTLPLSWLTAPLLLPAPLPQLSLVGWLAWPLQTLLSPLVLVCGGVFSTAQQLWVLATSAAHDAVWYGIACDVVFVKAAVRWACDGGWLNASTCSNLASAASDSAVQQQASVALVGLLSVVCMVWCVRVARRFARLAQPPPAPQPARRAQRSRAKRREM